MCHKYRAVVLIFALVLVACGASGASNEAQQPTAAASGICDAPYVASTDAGNHVGKEVTVCGKVIDYFYIDRGPDKPTLLFFDTGVVRRANFGITDFPEAFSVLIWRRDSKNFSPNFGSIYSGKVVCTTGVIETYDGRPVIVARTPDQIKVGC